ncbi:MAG TPA: von Willebrand factor type A domain-containing protein [Mucilaginibacter sp.]|nr:von Willebrand factor type A domain-containing protein [Mucilaginibacter sp.]
MKKIVLVALMIAGLAAFKCNNIRHITGTVCSNDDKLPIPGVSVKVKGSANTFAITDSKGKYAIDAPDGSTLVFSFIWYQTANIPIGKKDKIDVLLSPTSSSLNEVVVTGYSSQQKRDVNVSQTTITNADASSLVMPGLAGKASGVVAQQNVSANAPVMYKSYSPQGGTMNYSPSPAYNSATAPGDESYKHIDENGFSNPKDNPLSTFSVDVDAASYSNVRRFINEGQLPPPDAVRVEEMINYFKYNLSGPVNSDPVAIHTELSSAPWNPKHLLVRIGLKARTIDMGRLPASNLVFLLDVSGSMGEPNKLPLVKASMKMLVDQLRPQDRVAIVTYSGQAGVKLPSTPGDEKQKIKDAIDDLYAGGSTAGGEGIKLAYKIARENFVRNGNNRIIMATDGDFNVGDSSDGDMETLITRERYSNVPITIMGFGMGNYKDSKMEILADKGNGNYAYIDNLTEAHKTLVSEYGGTMFMVAKDVKLQVEFNPALVQAYRLVGYEDRLLNKEDFTNDRKDAGDMGSGHTVTAFYEIVPKGVNDDYSGSVDPLKYQKNPKASAGSYSNELMTVKFRYKQPDSDQSKLSVVTVKNTPVSFNSTSADFRFASAVAEFGMLLRNSDFKQNATYDQAISIARTARGEDEDGYRSEFVRLAETARSLAVNDPMITKY